MLFSPISFSVVAAAVYLAHASPLTFRADQPCTRNYTVAAGDTCNSISAAQEVSTFQLALDNTAIDAACDNLQPGQNLCLGIEGQDCTTVQVVADGDECGTIASGANIMLATLLANNPNINAGCTNIIPGEVLCIASDIIPYPTST